MFQKSKFIKLLYLSPFILLTTGFGCAKSIRSDELRNSTSIDSRTTKIQNEIQISDNDKEQIIVEILKNLRDIKKLKKDAEKNIINVEGRLPIKQIPQIEGVEIKFVLSSIWWEKHSQIVFYNFSDFVVKDSKIVISVNWNKFDYSSRHYSVVEYGCEKIADKWKVKGKIISAAVAET